MNATVETTQTTKPTTKPTPRDEHDPKRQPPYNVVLLDDDDHSYQYVLRMLKELFGYPLERGFLMAKEVDTSGRVILLTTTLEHAELKRDQIHAYGPDPMLSRSAGSMSAIIEPAETGGGGNDHHDQDGHDDG